MYTPRLGLPLTSSLLTLLWWANISTTDVPNLHPHRLDMVDIVLPRPSLAECPLTEEYHITGP